VLLGLFLVAHEPILLAVGDYLVVRDELQPADVIHVVSGPLDRADYAIDLYQQGYGQQLFFTGDWSSGLNMTYAQFQREYAVARGVPRADIQFDGGPVNSTYSEALRLRQFLEGSPTPVDSVIIVSDPHHTRRTGWAYGRVLDLPGLDYQLAPVPFEDSRHQRRWWSDALSLQMVTAEYVKTGYYFLRYEYSSGPVQQWLAILDIFP
jgi:uncharacterized SAM-binding protein YcdF (DUF218 family)